MFLVRILPIKRDPVVKIEIPTLKVTSNALESLRVITQAVMDGDISPSEEEFLSKVMEIHVKSIELHDHEQRLNLPESKNSQ